MLDLLEFEAIIGTVRNVGYRFNTSRDAALQDERSWLLATHEHDHDPIGEICFIGVNSRFQGHGIGRAVTIAGWKYLRYEGILSAMLYVATENTCAINLYTWLGFKEWVHDVLYK